MRIHRLTIEGIGPYATRQELDFDELTSAGLFLLTGPTGAGKTTVLDAVVFALYGTVPGARGADGKREKGARERLVSDLRDVDTRPEVELEFSAAGRRFIVRRSPDHDRPKARGTGTTLAKASAGLEEQINGDWVPRSTDFREISIELESVLGMSAAQFTQVVLLPQGEFAGFLRASVGDRRKVLERLFQVDRFDSAEQWFKARADDAKASLAAAQSQLDRVVERLSGALGDSAGSEASRAELTGPDEISAWVSDRRLEADERVLRTGRDAEEATATYGRADVAHRSVVAIAQQRRALDDREIALAEHAVRLPGARAWVASQAGDAIAGDEDAWMPAAREARARAHRLDARIVDERRLSNFEREAAAADGTAEQAARDADSADAVVSDRGARIEPMRAIAEDGARAEAAMDGLRRQRRDLDARVRATARRDALAAEVAAVIARLKSAASAASDANAALASLPEEEKLDGIAASLAARRADLTETRSVLESEVAQLIRDADAVAQGRSVHASLEQDHARLAAAQSIARERHLAARSAHLAAREARLDAMASELAAALHDGEACPVCGSVEHPAPAAGSGQGDLRAAEASAAAEVERTEQVLATAQQALDVCGGRLAAIDLAELDRRSVAITARGESRRGALLQLPGEEASLTREEATTASVVAARRAAVREATQRQATLAAVEREANGLRETLATAAAQAGDGPAPTDELADVDRRLESLTGQVSAGTAARDQIVELERAIEQARARGAGHRAQVAEQRQRARGLRAEHARIDAELRSARGEHASVEAAARAAGEHAYRLEKAAELLAAHRTALAEQAAAAASLAARVANDIAEPGEPDVLEERVAHRAARRDAASQAAMDAAAAAKLARVRQVAVEEAETSLASALRALGPAAEAAERLIRLDLTIRGGGDNVRKISLATYVLAARLEEVAAAATGHLLRMSSGRYELRHHDDRQGSGQAGLGLRVLDGHTGIERDTATLSGGEAFYASLSLALGLAEVVTNESGGRPLDTLLVDEGFGSLDPDTLEDVLGVLDELRAAGRSIGLVSHVDMLAERIPAQLRVTPGRGGSRAEVIVGAGSPA